MRILKVVLFTFLVILFVVSNAQQVEVYFNQVAVSSVTHISYAGGSFKFENGFGCFLDAGIGSTASSLLFRAGVGLTLGDPYGIETSGKIFLRSDQKLEYMLGLKVNFFFPVNIHFGVCGTLNSSLAPSLYLGVGYTFELESHPRNFKVFESSGWFPSPEKARESALNNLAASVRVVYESEERWKSELENVTANENVSSRAYNQLLRGSQLEIPRLDYNNLIFRMKRMFGKYKCSILVPEKAFDALINVLYIVTVAEHLYREGFLKAAWNIISAPEHGYYLDMVPSSGLKSTFESLYNNIKNEVDLVRKKALVAKEYMSNFRLDLCDELQEIAAHLKLWKDEDDLAYGIDDSYILNFLDQLKNFALSWKPGIIKEFDDNHLAFTIKFEFAGDCIADLLDEKISADLIFKTDIYSVILRKIAPFVYKGSVTIPTSRLQNREMCELQVHLGSLGVIKRALNFNVSRIDMRIIAPESLEENEDYKIKLVLTGGGTKSLHFYIEMLGEIIAEGSLLQKLEIPIHVPACKDLNSIPLLVRISHNGETVYTKKADLVIRKKTLYEWLGNTLMERLRRSFIPRINIPADLHFTGSGELCIISEQVENDEISELVFDFYPSNTRVIKKVPRYLLENRVVDLRDMKILKKYPQLVEKLVAGNIIDVCDVNSTNELPALKYTTTDETLYYLVKYINRRATNNEEAVIETIDGDIYIFLRDRIFRIRNGVKLMKAFAVEIPHEAVVGEPFVLKIEKFLPESRNFTLKLKIDAYELSYSISGEERTLINLVFPGIEIEKKKVGVRIKVVDSLANSVFATETLVEVHQYPVEYYVKKLPDLKNYMLVYVNSPIKFESDRGLEAAALSMEKAKLGLYKLTLKTREADYFTWIPVTQVKRTYTDLRNIAYCMPDELDWIIPLIGYKEVTIERLPFAHYKSSAKKLQGFAEYLNTILYSSEESAVVFEYEKSVFIAYKDRVYKLTPEANINDFSVRILTPLDLIYEGSKVKIEIAKFIPEKDDFALRIELGSHSFKRDIHLFKRETLELEIPACETKFCPVTIQVYRDSRKIFENSFTLSVIHRSINDWLGMELTQKLDNAFTPRLSIPDVFVHNAGNVPVFIHEIKRDKLGFAYFEFVFPDKSYVRKCPYYMVKNKVTDKRDIARILDNFDQNLIEKLGIEEIDDIADIPDAFYETDDDLIKAFVEYINSLSSSRERGICKLKGLDIYFLTSRTAVVMKDGLNKLRKFDIYAPSEAIEGEMYTITIRKPLPEKRNYRAVLEAGNRKLEKIFDAAEELIWSIIFPSVDAKEVNLKITMLSDEHAFRWQKKIQIIRKNMDYYITKLVDDKSFSPVLKNFPFLLRSEGRTCAIFTTGRRINNLTQLIMLTKDSSQSLWIPSRLVTKVFTDYTPLIKCDVAQIEWVLNELGYTDLTLEDLSEEHLYKTTQDELKGFTMYLNLKSSKAAGTAYVLRFRDSIYVVFKDRIYKLAHLFEPGIFELKEFPEQLVEGEKFVINILKPLPEIGNFTVEVSLGDRTVATKIEKFDNVHLTLPVPACERDYVFLKVAVFKDGEKLFESGRTVRIMHKTLSQWLGKKAFEVWRKSFTPRIGVPKKLYSSKGKNPLLIKKMHEDSLGYTWFEFITEKQTFTVKIPRYVVAEDPILTDFRDLIPLKNQEWIMQNLKTYATIIKDATKLPKAHYISTDPELKDMIKAINKFTDSATPEIHVFKVNRDICFVTKEKFWVLKNGYERMKTNNPPDLQKVIPGFLHITLPKSVGFYNVEWTYVEKDGDPILFEVHCGDKVTKTTKPELSIKLEKTGVLTWWIEAYDIYGGFSKSRIRTIKVTDNTIYEDYISSLHEDDAAIFEVHLPEFVEYLDLLNIKWRAYIEATAAFSSHKRNDFEVWILPPGNYKDAYIHTLWECRYKNFVSKQGYLFGYFKVPEKWDKFYVIVENTNYGITSPPTNFRDDYFENIYICICTEPVQ